MIKFLLWLIYSIFISNRYVSSSYFDQTCTCAIVDGDNVNEPMLEQTFGMALTCDETGKLHCINFCVSLAVGAQTSGNARLFHIMLCEQVEEDVEFYVSVFSRVCDFPYVTSGLAYAIRLCCKDRKPEICDLERITGSEHGSFYYI